MPSKKGCNYSPYVRPLERHAGERARPRPQRHRLTAVPGRAGCRRGGARAVGRAAHPLARPPGAALPRAFAPVLACGRPQPTTLTTSHYTLHVYSYTAVSYV